jgi:ABC-type uncharacterized transport system permease subunit
MFLQKITLLCFGASYGVSLALELWYLLRPRPVYRLVALGFGLAGMAAQTLYLFARKPSLSSDVGTMLFLALILAIFYVYGSLHHRRVAWGVFVLPLVIGLVVLAWAGADSGSKIASGKRFWGYLHVSLLILAAVGVCVAFLSSVMYLIQAAQLKRKVPMGHGLKLLSLERLEQMHRRAIILAFPFLTAGLIVGMFLMIDLPFSWFDPRVVASTLLWLVFVLLLCLRYGFHLRGRSQAMLTILAFALLLVTMAWPHFGPGGGP